MSSIDVADDPELLPEEKEVMIRWARGQGRATIHAEQGTVVKWLVRHPDFEEDARRVKDGVLHAVSGTLPVGVVKLSGKPRNSNQTGRVLGQLPEDDA